MRISAQWLETYIISQALLAAALAWLRLVRAGRSPGRTLWLARTVVVALPVTHRFASRERIAVSDLADEALILPPRVQVPIVHDLVLRLCREARFVPKVPHEIDHPQMVLGLVATGVGIAFLPAWVRKTRSRGVVLRALRPSPRILQTALAWRRDAAWPLVRGYVEAVRPLWPGE